MKKDAKIYVAGHRGMVGSAIVRHLKAQGYTNLVTAPHAQLDLIDQKAVSQFFNKKQPEYVFLAAAKVGGIFANNRYPAQFIYDNLMVQSNVIHASFKNNVKRLLFLGSSCIYPKHAPQPIQEAHLLTGELEPTNEPYAVAKIAGLKMCHAYNRQYGTCFIPVMPNNMYGPNDNYDLETSHVLPAFIRKFHLARLASKNDQGTITKDEKVFGAIPDDVKMMLNAISKNPDQGAVALWGSGAPFREWLHVDDLAEACLFIMNLDADRLDAASPAPQSPLFNIGWGQDLTIKELAVKVAGIVGYAGKIDWDTSKPDGTPRKLLDVYRMTRLGWSPKIRLDQGIKAAYDDYLARLAALHEQ